MSCKWRLPDAIWRNKMPGEVDENPQSRRGVLVIGGFELPTAKIMSLTCLGK
jgi:hypothetical protein